MMLGWIDVLGYAASGMTLATFAQRTMLPMRIMALGANCLLHRVRGDGPVHAGPDTASHASSHQPGPAPHPCQAVLRGVARGGEGDQQCHGRVFQRGCS